VRWASTPRRRGPVAVLGFLLARLALFGCSAGPSEAARGSCFDDSDCRIDQVCVFDDSATDAGGEASVMGPDSAVEAAGMAGLSDLAEGGTGGFGGASGPTSESGTGAVSDTSEAGAAALASIAGGATAADGGFVQPDASIAAEPPPLAPVGPTSGMCRCRDDLCPAGTACSAEFNDCEPAPCSATTRCGGADPLYCDLTVHTCNLRNGQCGTVGDSDYSCPTLKGWLAPDVSVVCAHPDLSVPGVCGFQFSLPLVPAPADATADLTVAEPHDGQSFAVGDDIEFQVLGSSLTTFFFVTDSLPTDAAMAAKQALWGATFPATGSSDSTRTVLYSRGHAIADGVWQATAGNPPTGTTLYFLAYALEQDHIARVPEQAVRFRVGDAGVVQGVPCTVTPQASGAVSPAARLQACTNPNSALACVSNQCRALCLSARDCTTGQCTLHQDLGIQTCD
jgi:hypothetical protein